MTARLPGHERCARWIETVQEPLLVPNTVLTEVCYLLQRRCGTMVEARTAEGWAGVTAVTETGARVDPDVDLPVVAERRELRPRVWPVLAAISAGGVLGAIGRHLIEVTLTGPASGFDWAGFVVNVSGCLLIGILMVLVEQVWAGRRLLRPFLGVGVLGGFTTFSGYVQQVQQMATAGAARTGLVYLAATLAAALLAVWTGAAATGWLIHHHRRVGSARTRRAGRVG